MDRRRYLQLCMLKSLSKRLWSIVMFALAVTVVLIALEFQAGHSAVGGLIALLIVAGYVAWSSYSRHRDDPL